MSFTQHKFNVSHLVELSTLTGAIKPAIGENLAGLFTNTEDNSKILKKLKKFSDENFWYLPICDEHRNAMKY